MNLHEELCRLREERIAAVQLPRVWPQVIFSSDISKRISTCQWCQKAIPTKTKRAFIMARFERRYKNGGKGFNEKFYFHPSCIVDIMGDQIAIRSRPKLQCWDCRIELVGNSHTSVSVGYRSMTGMVCASCAKQPRYRQCGFCGSLYARRMTSPILEAPVWLSPVEVGIIICDSCSEADGYVTQKMRSRAERAEQAFTRRYDTIAEKLQRGKGFE